MSYLMFLMLVWLQTNRESEIRPSIDNAIKELCEGTEDQRQAATGLLVSKQVAPLPKEIQQQLFDIFANRERPAEVRQAAWEVLAQISAILSGHEDSLVKILKSKEEPTEIRVGALISIQPLLKKETDTETIRTLMFEILGERAEDAVLRAYVANALIECEIVDKKGSIPKDPLVACLMSIVSSREESPETRLQMLELIGGLSLSPPSKLQTIAASLFRIAADSEESTEIRVGALEPLCSFFMDLDSETMPPELVKACLQISQKLIDFLANDRLDDELREAAGRALRVCPGIDVELVRQLHFLLTSEDRFTHQFAIKALYTHYLENPQQFEEALKESGLPLSQTLKQIWRDLKESPKTRESAKKALIEFDSDAAQQLGSGEGMK